MSIKISAFDAYWIEKSEKKYYALPTDEWVKQWFCADSGGFVAAHVKKTVDNMTRNGIAAEVRGCMSLAKMGKHVLRLPENIPNLIDEIFIEGKPYRELLKFRIGETKPRGYPDVYFDGQTWDFKAPTYQNVDSVRQLIKESRKADNVIFVVSNFYDIAAVHSAIGRECGRRKGNVTLNELPNVYYLLENQLTEIWIK